MAAGALEIVRDYVNTYDVETGTDGIASAGGLVSWLHGHALVPATTRATSADVKRAAELREALRACLLANNGGAAAASAVETLTRQAARARIQLSFRPSQAELVPAVAGVDAGLGRLLVLVAGAMADGSWSRLKACPAVDCAWAFIDRSRNGSRHWCAMEVCGNREKVRAFRTRAARP